MTSPMQHDVNEQSRESKRHELSGAAASSGNNEGAASQHNPSSQANSQPAGTIVGGQNSGTGAPATSGAGGNVGTADYQQQENGAGGAFSHSQQGVPAAGNLEAQGNSYGTGQGDTSQGINNAHQSTANAKHDNRGVSQEQRVAEAVRRM